MKTCDVDVDRIWKVWHWCSDSYLQYGIKLSFPQHTDPHKTYQWRYCQSLARKFMVWDFDDGASEHFINVAVKHAKKIGTIRKGLSVLHQKDMIDVVCGLLQEEDTRDDRSLDSLRYAKKWLNSQIGNSNPVTIMLERSQPDTFCNIVIWHQANKLPDLYIALSRSCCKALARLKKQDLDERNLLPKVTELYQLRSNFLKDTDCTKQIKRILGEDWRKLCH